MNKQSFFNRIPKKYAIIISSALFIAGVICYVFSFRYNHITSHITLDRISGILMIAGLIGLGTCLSKSKKDEVVPPKPDYMNTLDKAREMIYGDDDEGKEEISVISEKLGKFIYRRKPKWYEAVCDWRGEKIQVNFTEPQSGTIQKQLKNIEDLFDKQDEIDRKIRDMTVAELERLKRENKYPNELEETESTVYAKRIVPGSIDVDPYGGYEMYFDDVPEGSCCSVRVLGTFNEGLSDIEIMG